MNQEEVYKFVDRDRVYKKATEIMETSRTIGGLFPTMSRRIPSADNITTLTMYLADLLLRVETLEGMLSWTQRDLVS